MKLNDIYTQLSSGELRQLFLRDIDNPLAGVKEEMFPQLLPSIQLGLTELHKRFALREGHMTVPLVSGEKTYPLVPTSDVVLKVEHVYGVYGQEPYRLVLDELRNPEAVRMSTLNSLMIPTDEEQAPWLKETTELAVVYRADHPKINAAVANAAPLAVTIDLPMSHLEALCFYVASRIHNPMGMTPGAMHEGNNYFQRFLESVQTLKNQNLELDSDDDCNGKLYSRGFV